MTSRDSIPFPLCFDTKDDYVYWEKTARKVRESSTPCDDCTAEHRERMGAARCQEQIVREVFIINITRAKRAF